MKHLVGTLVRYANGGQFEPYLAEQFSSKAQGTVWTFRLKSNLTCQNGEQITAAGYVNGLKKVLRSYAKQGPIPIISDLVGWNDFLAGNGLEGVSANTNGEVEFHFSRPAGSGFLEYLSMPYYGYLCEANFHQEKWVSKDAIVSSGPYVLARNLNSKDNIELILRSDWPHGSTSAPKSVIYRTEIPSSAWKQSGTIIQASLPWDQGEPEGFRRIWGPPDVVRAVALNDQGPSSYFAKQAARRKFQQTILNLREKSEFKSTHATLAKSFYASAQTLSPLAEDISGVGAPGKELLVYIPETTEPESLYAGKLILAALAELKWPYKRVNQSDYKGSTVTGAFRKANFDISLVGVVAGSVIEPWTAHMMFCSNLGVTFPEPTGRVCKFITELMKSDQSFSIEAAGFELSKIVHEDAAVIPMYHGRTTWYFSNDLDVSRISGDLIIPSFDDIGMKD